MRADEIGVVDPAVVDIAAGLHLGLDLLDDVAFLDDVVLHPDTGDLGKGLGQRLGLVLVRGDRLGDDADIQVGEGLGGIDEPLHLLHLIFLGQRRGLELVIDPLLRRRLVGPGRSREGSRAGRQGDGADHHRKAYPVLHASHGFLLGTKDRDDCPVVRVFLTSPS